MSSLRDRLRKIIEKEEEIDSRLSNSGVDSEALSELQGVEDGLAEVLQAELADIPKIAGVLRELLEWENAAETVIADQSNNIASLQATLEKLRQNPGSEKLRQKALRTGLAVNQELQELDEKISPAEELSGEQVNHLEELRELGDMAEAVDGLDRIIDRLEQGEEVPGLEELESRRQKIDRLSSELQELARMKEELEQPEIDHKSVYERCKALSKVLESIEPGDTVLEEQELDALEATVENYRELLQEIAGIEDSQEGLSRRNFLKIVGTASLVGLAAASEVYEGSLKRQKSDFLQLQNEELGHTEKFLYAYYRELYSYLRNSGMSLGRHNVIAENHSHGDAIAALADFVREQKPAAVGLEFFYEKDEYLVRFNRGEISVSEVVNHWVQTEENINMLGRDRPEEGARELLKAGRENGVDFYGLEWVRRSYYPSDAERKFLTSKDYRKRSRKMSEIAAKIAERYGSSAFFVGYSHASIPVNYPFLLPRAAAPQYADSFSLEDFYENPYLIHKYRETDEGSIWGSTNKDLMDFYRYPGLRIEDFLAKNGFSTSTVLATSAGEQKTGFENATSEFGQVLQEDKNPHIAEAIEKTFEKLEKRQPLNTSSHNSYGVMLRKSLL
ncbi:MAG: hypothetical protein ABEI58_00030 [Candidatus Nanohaloarchaea archaeon]